MDERKLVSELLFGRLLTANNEWRHFTYLFEDAGPFSRPYIDRMHARHGLEVDRGIVEHRVMLGRYCDAVLRRNS
jgi:hypothetical protein